MEQKNTDELQLELMSTPNLDNYLSENQPHFSHASTAAILKRLFEQRSISKSELAKDAGMSEIYLHQIFAGRRNPSRSRLICLCYGLRATLDETQELLRQCGLAQLYPKIRRDSIIMYGIVHGTSLFDINDKLFEEDEETLF